VFIFAERMMTKTNPSSVEDPPSGWPKLGELSEDDLRRKIILPLLAATKGIHRINDVHGKNEKGLDIIFFEKSAIQDTCYGLQLKRDNIGGGGTKEGTVKEIIDQLGIAQDLTHPVAVEGIGRVQIDRFVVATSGRISETAREEIASRIKGVPVTFWDRFAIERRARELMPELFSVADGSAVVYLKGLAARYDTLDTLDQIPGVARRTLTQIYEEPTLRRRFDPTLVNSDEKSTGAVVRFPALRLADLDQHSVVIGEQDDGKTALLRMLVLKRARNILTGPLGDERSHLPVLLRASDVIAAGRNVVGAIRTKLARFEAHPLVESLEADLATSGYLVLVDGFSELKHEKEKDEVEIAVKEFIAQYHKARVIVAGRPADFLTVKYFQDLRHHVLEDFNNGQVASLLNRWTSDSPALADVAKKLVKRIREALQLPGSPISATIGVMLYETERRFITNTAEAVDRYMVIRLGRYAHELGMRQQVDWSRKQDLLAEVAFFMIQTDVDSLRENDFVSMIDKIYERLGETPMGSVVLGELLEGGVVVRTGDFLSFHRTAFRDFFAGHGINQLPDRDRFFEENLFDRKWGLPLTFAAGLRRRNTALFPRLLKKVHDEHERAVGEPSSDYYYGAYLLGRILSNSETTDEDIRLEVLEECILAFERSLPEFVATAKKQFGNIGELAALMGIEQSFFVTVGVPWLEKQFRQIATSKTSTASDDGRFLAASTYAQLGGEDYLGVLDFVAKKTSSTRVLMVLRVAAIQLLQARGATKKHRGKLRSLLGRLNRRLSREGRKDEAKKLLQIRSRVLQLEAKRMQRLENT
jgi:hypothetical protein